MPSQRRKTAGASAPAPAPAPPALVGMGYLSADYISSLGMDPTSPTVKQTFKDARDVYQVINDSPGITQDQLVSWATSHFSTDSVDRLNAAIALLVRLNCILNLG